MLLGHMKKLIYALHVSATIGLKSQGNLEPNLDMLMMFLVTNAMKCVYSFHALMPLETQFPCLTCLGHLKLMGLGSLELEPNVLMMFLKKCVGYWLKVQHFHATCNLE